MCQPENSHQSPHRPPCPGPDLKPLPSSLTYYVTLDIWLSFSGPLCLIFILWKTEGVDHRSSSYSGYGTSSS